MTVEAETLDIVVAVAQIDTAGAEESLGMAAGVEEAAQHTVVQKLAADKAKIRVEVELLPALPCELEIRM